MTRIQSIRWFVLAVLIVVPVSGLADECMECHGDKDSLDPWRDGTKLESLPVAEGALKGSVHEDLDCSDCHVMADTEDDTGHYEEGGIRPTMGCAECHDEVSETYYEECVHGKALKNDHPHAPDCTSCHGGHRILPGDNPNSMVAPAMQPTTCGRCHDSEALNEESHITKRRLIPRYKDSVHWKNIERSMPGASCSDCHGSHSIRTSSDSDSMVSRVNLLTTCAKCHPQIVSGYSTGSHGRTLLAGNLDVPTCTTCHGDHDIMSLRAEVGARSTFARTEVCIWCHGNDRMMARYSLDTTPVDSYLKDFHGLSQKGSSGTAATCADCHDAHHSLPSGHPESRMHISNRGAACGKCHGQQGDSFIMSFTHKLAAEDPGHNINWWIKIIYIILILVVIGGMLIHNLVIWFYFAKRKYRYQKKKGTVRRLNGVELGWHWAMLVAFTSLGLTGFALTYSDSFVFSWLYDIGLKESTRAWLHRFFAVVLTLDMGLFFIWSLISRHGRKRWWIQMMPRWRDFKDFAATMRYYMGRQKEKPRYDVFNYGEKAEYWALWWGTVVMLLSGLILWFSEMLPSDAPPWTFTVARTVHFYEAVLACLAIVVWHFYHTIWHPEEYPIGTSFITGKLTPHEAEERFTDEAIADQMEPEEEEDPEPPMPEKAWLEENEKEKK